VTGGKIPIDGSNQARGSDGPTGGDGGDRDEHLLQARAWIIKYGVGTSLLLVVVWPLACAPLGVFPKAIYALWTAVAVIWGWLAALLIVFVPLWENRATFAQVISCQTAARRAKVQHETEGRELPELRNGAGCRVATGTRGATRTSGAKLLLPRQNGNSPCDRPLHSAAFPSAEIVSPNVL